VIRSWRHKGLRDFFETGSRAGIQAHHAGRLRRQLGTLDQASTPTQMAIPGWKLHGLSTGEWAIWVSGNWRLTFAFEGEDAIRVDYQDYH
jgi:toxin HigB-1